MTGRGSLLALALLAVGGAPLCAQVEPLETHIQVRVLAGDAKLIGDVVGGARVKIVDARSGEILAEGVTTGDTERIMGTPRARGATVFDTPGAAGWLARFPLEAPTVVRIEAEGPLGFPHAVARASRTMVLKPGTRIVGGQARPPRPPRGSRTSPQADLSGILGRGRNARPLRRG